MRVRSQCDEAIEAVARRRGRCWSCAMLSGCSYNTFVSQEEAIKAQWSQVENQLQRRTDLIPNLVETVKGYAAHESGVFQAVAESRAKLAGAKTPEDTIAAANEQTSALARLLAVVENYPQLKANESFNRLMDELSAPRTASPSSGCATTRGCRSTTRAAAVPVERHGVASSASRQHLTSKRPPRRAKRLR